MIIITCSQWYSLTGHEAGPLLHSLSYPRLYWDIPTTGSVSMAASDWHWSYCWSGCPSVLVQRRLSDRWTLWTDFLPVDSQKVLAIFKCCFILRPDSGSLIFKGMGEYYERFLIYRGILLWIGMVFQWLVQAAEKVKRLYIPQHK